MFPLHITTIALGATRAEIAINPFDVSRIDPIHGSNIEQCRVFLRNGTVFDKDGSLAEIVAEFQNAVKTFDRGW